MLQKIFLKKIKGKLKKKIKILFLKIRLTSNLLRAQSSALKKTGARAQLASAEKCRARQP